MTIWLLALVLMAALAALGYRQGAIRVAFSLVGILVGVFLAGLLGRFLKPVLGAVGVKNPVLLWLLGPLVVFVLVSIVFKVGAFSLHHKVDVYFKYKAGDLRLALWERLNRRLGSCLGVVNGAMYFILISFVIYSFSYWTVQMASAEGDPKPVAILNRLGHDLESSGFIKVAGAIDPLPQSFFDTADIAGIFYNNPLTEARFSRYPAFLKLAERPEFQGFENDTQFAEMRSKRQPIKDLLNYPRVQGIVSNPDLLKEIWATLEPDLKDLEQFLNTGRSPKYESEPILGRWEFDVAAALRSMHQSKPNMSSTEMQRLKKWMMSAFSKTSFVAMTDHQAILKNLPSLKPPAPNAPPPGPQTVQGQWQSADGKYQINLPTGEMNASIEGDRLVFKSPGMDLAFSRED
jgi:hypothetical protein